MQAFRVRLEIIFEVLQTEIKLAVDELDAMLLLLLLLLRIFSRSHQHEPRCLLALDSRRLMWPGHRPATALGKGLEHSLGPCEEGKVKTTHAKPDDICGSSVSDFTATA